MYYLSKSIMKRVPQSPRSNSRRLWRIIGISTLVVIAAVLGFGLLLKGADISVLNPQGIIAEKQKKLLIFTFLLGMVVVIPVFIMLFGFAWRYREGNGKAKYTPDHDHDKWLEVLWWGIPIAIIGILSVVTWVTSHDLDPYKSLSSDKKPVTIRVVALQWKWLFLYPEQGIATVNEVRFPEDTPVNFELTADAPMNGFWIPSLGSQTYAMTGMSSKLSLQANTTGEYRGSSTNISGEGYAGMDFTAVSMTRTEFDRWAGVIAAESGSHLDWDIYQELAKPSKDAPVTYYMLHEPALYDKIIAKYMQHGGSTPEKTETSASSEGHGGH